MPINIAQMYVQTSLFVILNETLQGKTNVTGNMNSYWKLCKYKDMFITGRTTAVYLDRVKEIRDR